ncbi:putative RNA-directed DNA polymerase [Helianthus annuus]|nr:putative RNA-directed DNA polymerase [Helianthus annuus]KAJ0495149.1 putative RNA-directed DNA polymerase [Helianthus annuus]KAJ0506733.1 putative RNA-directed DNA polymerase [Helianthus annuus]KAJ0676413.1 putative RNA-directed DNA polymerase [Helianthus annuus]
MDGDGKTAQPDSSQSAIKSNLHPAYSVTNIQSKIRTLDGKKVTYSAWIKLFRLHATAYQVLNHIDETPPPEPKSPEYPSWKELDALVLQWIYATLSDDLLLSVLENESTARTAWVKLETKFLSNKKARAGALETKFCNLTLSACKSLDDYCQQLKDLANQLADVDHPITEDRLVLQLVRGLPAEFDTTASLINANNAGWDLARNMLNDEVIRLEARQKSTNSVLMAQNQTPNNQHSTNPYPSYSPTPNQQPPNHTGYSRGGRGRGRGRSYRGGRGRGYGRSQGQQQYQQPWAPQQSSYPQWAWWSTPPCPYPTQPSYQPATPYQQPSGPPTAHYTAAPNSAYPSTPPQHPGPPQTVYYQPHAGPNTYGQHQQGPPGSGSPQQPAYNALCPSDIGAAMASMNLTYDPNTIMDSGAGGHATDEQGPSNWAPPFPPQ